MLHFLLATSITLFIMSLTFSEKALNHGRQFPILAPFSSSDLRFMHSTFSTLKFKAPKTMRPILQIYFKSIDLFIYFLILLIFLLLCIQIKVCASCWRSASTVFLLNNFVDSLGVAVLKMFFGKSQQGQTTRAKFTDKIAVLLFRLETDREL